MLDFTGQLHATLSNCICGNLKGPPESPATFLSDRKVVYV